MSLEYRVDVERELEAIRAQLGELQEQAPQVLRSAIRKAAGAVRKTMLARAQERYAVDNPRLLTAKTLKLKTDSDAMTVTLHAKGKPNALSYFEHTSAPNSSLPVAAHVLAQNAMRQISGEPKPFVVALNSSHIAIMRRVPGETYRSGRAYTARRLLGWDLTRIEQLHTIATPAMLYSDEVIDAANKQFGELMPEMIKAAVKAAIKKAAKKGAQNK